MSTSVATDLRKSSAAIVVLSVLLLVTAESSFISALTCDGKIFLPANTNISQQEMESNCKQFSKSLKNSYVHSDLESIFHLIKKFMDELGNLEL